MKKSKFARLRESFFRKVQALDPHVKFVRNGHVITGYHSCAHEEGYSSMWVQARIEGNRFLRTTQTEDRDCDGRVSSNSEEEFRHNRSKHWRVFSLDRNMRDQYAEMMGY